MDAAAPARRPPGLVFIWITVALDILAIGVVIPVLVDRGTQYSGDERLRIYTNQSHREWIYRPAAEVGRHIARHGRYGNRPE